MFSTSLPFICNIDNALNCLLSGTNVGTYTVSDAATAKGENVSYTMTGNNTG